MPEIKRVPAMRVASVTRVGPFRQSIQDGMQALFAWLAKSQVQPVGAPLAIFPDDPAEVPEERLRAFIGVPVGPDVVATGEVELREIGDFDAATTIYEGAENLDRVYGELYVWLHAKGYLDAGSPMESYLSEPSEVLRAEVFIPVARTESATSGAPRRAVKKTAKAAAKKSARKLAKKTARKAAKKTAKKAARGRSRK